MSQNRQRKAICVLRMVRLNWRSIAKTESGRESIVIAEQRVRTQEQNTQGILNHERERERVQGRETNEEVYYGVCREE